MGDRTAASAGFVAAGVALAAALSVPSTTGHVAAALAGLAAAGFALRRHGRLDRHASLAAGAAGLGSALVAGYAAVVPPGRVAGAGVVAAGGLLGGALAYADWRGVTREGLARRTAVTLAGAGIGAAGLAAIFGWTVVVGSVARAASAGELDASTRTALSTVAGGLGTATVALFYLRATDRGAGFVDARVPAGRDLAYALGGVLALLGLNLGLGHLFRRLGIETATHTVIRTARADPTVLLVLIPLAYLFIGPGEELLFRNVVQKSLYGAFSRPGAIVVASAIFAGAHAFSYLAPTPGATLAGLSMVFALSLVLGAVYERTDSVVVPALVHATFDAIAFAAAYADLAGLG